MIKLTTFGARQPCMNEKILVSFKDEYRVLTFVPFGERFELRDEAGNSYIHDNIIGWAPLDGELAEPTEEEREYKIKIDEYRRMKEATLEGLETMGQKLFHIRQAARLFGLSKLEQSLCEADVCVSKADAFIRNFAK